ncbi:MAG: RNA-directed DNA polymerase [Omnitrophica bacterium]|nr:RNA-directed DNA polymerase [Candidatus Omnitrophota bacterium]
MKIISLLKKGYFPKELPPAFTTEYFANKYSAIAKDYRKLGIREKSESKCVNFSILRQFYSRRDLGIPNPIHQSNLSKCICDNWAQINRFYKKSRISASKPIVDLSHKRAVRTNSFAEFKKLRLLNSYDKIYELKTDISRFYATLYTHAIPWALHTKAVAKRPPRDPRLLGNVLDKSIRACQARQSIGIPVGPDTSLIIAEIISCEIDNILQNKFKDLRGYRYYDDYYFFFSKLEDAEKVLKEYQCTLTSLNLDINEEKTEIREHPIPSDKVWAIEIGSFRFRNSDKTQENDLEKFFSISFKFAKENPKDSVLKYAIKKIEYIKIRNKNWPFFESLLLKTALVAPLTLPEVTRILYSYSKRVDKSKVKNVVEQIIEKHVLMGHSFEVSWSLWLAKTFHLKINDDIAKHIFNSSDVISILIALDLKSMRLIDSKVDTSSLLNELTENSLYDDKWLLTYESIIKKWLNPTSDPVSIEPYFKTLKKHKVRFYDGTKQVEIIKFKKRRRAPTPFPGLARHLRMFYADEEPDEI